MHAGYVKMGGSKDAVQIGLQVLKAPLVEPTAHSKLCLHRGPDQGFTDNIPVTPPAMFMDNAHHQAEGV